MKRIGIQFVSLILILSSCKRNNEKVAASIDGVDISISEVDKLAENKLYDKLYEIYYIRRIALEDLLESRLIEQEALSLGISTDSLLKSLNTKMDSTSILSFAKDNNIDRLIPVSSKPGTFLNADSKEGKDYLEELYTKELRRAFIDSLKSKHKIQILINPPKIPKIIIPKEVVRYPMNSSDADNEILFVGSISCQYTKALYPVVKKLMSTYSTRFNFFYVPLPDEINNTELMIGNQTTVELNNTLDKMFLSSENLVSSNADIHEYSKLEIDQHVNSLLTSIKKLKALGIASTPTLIINNRIYFGNYTYEEISKHLDDSL